MNSTAPHFLLFTQANDEIDCHRAGGRWKFVLEEIGSDFRIEEADFEPDVTGERLQLFAVIRGLEALEQPSTVTLVTPSRHVGHGIRNGLHRWKRHHWKHEVDGAWQTIPCLSEWQRIEAALQFHRISCRVWQFDAPHARAQPTESTPRRTTPFVSSFAEAGDPVAIESDVPRPNRIRIDREVRTRFFDSQSADELVPMMLESRIKPIGQGRAYGYAIN
jgi:ribonuclease HI